MASLSFVRYKHSLSIASRAARTAPNLLYRPSATLRCAEATSCHPAVRPHLIPLQPLSHLHSRSFVTFDTRMTAQQGRKTNLQLLDDCDSFPYEQIPLLTSGEAGYYAFLLPEDDCPHGYIAPSVVEQMPWTSDFRIDATQQPRRVTLLDTSQGTDTAAACNASFRTLLQAAQDKGVFAKTLGRKAEGEDFRIMAARNYQGKRALVQLRRSAAPLFGIANRGAHMTVYTKSAEGKYRFWVPRRSRHLRTYPGMLDNTVAGGVKAEESPLECIIHEADEEASLPEEFVAKHVRPVGMITYVTQTGSGGGSDKQAAVGGFDVGLCVPDVLYNYDLEVPTELVEEIVPKPRDDEVEEFYLWDLETVQEAMAKGEFKPNTALALIDFFIRHGIVNEGNEPDLVDIVARLHRKLHVPTSRQW